VAQREGALDVTNRRKLLLWPGINFLIGEMRDSKLRPALRLAGRFDSCRWRRDVDRSAARRPERKFIALARPWIAVWVALFLIGLGTIGAAAADDAEARSSSPLLGILWFSIRGLDVDHNELDSILADHGQLCVHEYRGYILAKPGECEVERAFTRFLQRLPPSRSAIASKLRSLGAVCKQARARLTCIYRKRENYRAFIGAVLISEEDGFYTVEFGVTKVGSKLKYFTNAERKATTIYDWHATPATKPAQEK
jgi:hypothetical protein